MPSYSTPRTRHTVVAAVFVAWLAVTHANVALAQQDGIEMLEGGYLRAEYDQTFEDYAEGVTIEGWFYFDSPPQDDRYWPLWFKAASYGVFLSGRLDNGGPGPADPPGTVWFRIVGFRSNGWGTSSRGYAPGRFPLNRWVHISVGVTADGVRIRRWAHLDGQVVGRGSSVYGVEDTPLLIGGMDPALQAGPYHRILSRAGSMSGSIDSMRVSRGVRYTDQVIAPKRPLGADRDTLALWTFGGPATVLYADRSRHGRHLRASGSLAVEAGGKAATLWGRLRARGRDHGQQRR